MKKEKLTLQITKENFDLILAGKQKVETRAVFPDTTDRYLIVKENGDDSCDVEVIEYSFLYLINGRRKDSPRLTVEVTESKLVIPNDDKGNQITYEEDGETYVSCWMEYSLGNVVNKENC